MAALFFAICLRVVRIFACGEKLIEILDGVHEDVTGLRADERSDYAGLFQLIDNSRGPRVSDGQLALEE